jgi:oligopeptidase B
MPDFPVADMRPHPITQHGQTRVDEYFWMRYRDDPAVTAYLQAENDYAEEMMQPTGPLQERLFQEMKARIKEDDATVPERRGEFLYYTRTAAGRQYPTYCRKRGSLDAPEETLLDQNVLAEGNAFCRLGAFSVSPDGTKLAYSIDPDGSEKCVLSIKDLTTGQLLPETFDHTYGDVYGHRGVEWSNDSRCLFYVTLDAAQRPERIWRHSLGTARTQDELLYHEVDGTFYLFLYKTRSRRFILAYSHSTTTDEWRILPADQPRAGFRVFEPRQPGVEYTLEHHGQRFFVRTNADAQNFRLMETPDTATSSANWREVIPHRHDVLLDDVEAFAHYLVLLERRGGLKQIRISAPDGRSGVRYVPFPEKTYSLTPAANPEFEATCFRFTYSSPVTPDSVVDLHMDTGAWEVKKQTEIPSGYDPAQYVSERMHATAPDGTRVPMSIVYRKGLARNGQNPALLFGYGAYGYSYDAAFNSNHFSLIDRGFVVAIGHIRGGSDLGRAWYDAGRLLNKKNSFHDFIACAEYLISEGYTSREKLGLIGVSAGGLLVSACLTMRPELFGAVIAKVPFVDVVSTMSDASIPLTTQEYDQWGNPDDKTHFGYMRSYSPYDNIRATDYPHVLITSGLNDPRVAYWEPAKFAARLRALKTDDHLLLLKTNLDAGHAGASGRYDLLREIAFEYAFLLDRLGVKS